MDFITRYYKNLAEELQARKENLLLEVARRRQTVPPVDPYTGNPGNPLQNQLQNIARLPGMEWAQPTPQQYFSSRPNQVPVAPASNPARIPGMEWAQPTPQQYSSTRSQGRVAPTLLQNPANPSAPASMGMIPGPGGMPVPLMNPNAMPSPQAPNLLARDPNVPAPGVPGVDTFGPPSPAVPGVDTFGPPSPAVPGVNTFGPPSPAIPGVDTFGPPSPAIPGVDTFGPPSPAIPGVDTFGPPSPVPGTSPTMVAPMSATTTAAAPAAAPAAAAFAGRGPLMGKKDQAAYDKMVGDMMKARGMPVPMLRTGKGGNYQEWRAAVDARSAAMRDANIAITLRQNQMRDQQNLARQNRDAAKAAGDDAAVARYQQELNDINRARGNLNKDTGRYSLGSDTTSQGRIANDQLQASWERRKADFKARTGMDYDASNPEHTRVMQTPNMSPEAMQTALSVGAFNKEWSSQNAENARKEGELDRSVDAKTAELNKLRTNPDYRKEVRQKDIQAALDSGQVDPVALDAENEKGVDARFDRLRGQLKAQAEVSGEQALGDMQYNRRRAREDQIRRLNPIYNAANPNPQVQYGTRNNFSVDADGNLANNQETTEFSPMPARVRSEMQARRQAANSEPNMSGRPNIPSLNMVGNAIQRARANSNTTTPIQRATVMPPTVGTTPSNSAPVQSGTLPPVSTGGMNTPADINDPQANARKPRGNVVTAAARTMGPNSSVPRLS